MKTTSLKTSQAIKELGIEVESTFSHKKWFLNAEERWDVVLSKEMEYDYPERYPAYTLSELPSVLQAVGEKLRWKNLCTFSGDCGKHLEGKGPCEDVIQETWIYHFLEICELHARGEDWDEVLYELVTRR